MDEGQPFVKNQHLESTFSSKTIFLRLPLKGHHIGYPANAKDIISVTHARIRYIHELAMDTEKTAQDHPCRACEVLQPLRHDLFAWIVIPSYFCSIFVRS
jgi:hypothetical protein